jgi:hypothetical protein
MERVSIWRMSRMMDRVMGGVRSAMRRLRIAAFEGLCCWSCMCGGLVWIYPSVWSRGWCLASSVWALSSYSSFV